MHPSPLTHKMYPSRLTYKMHDPCLTYKTHPSCLPYRRRPSPLRQKRHSSSVSHARCLLSVLHTKCILPAFTALDKSLKRYASDRGLCLEEYVSLELRGPSEPEAQIGSRGNNPLSPLATLWKCGIPSLVYVRCTYPFGSLVHSLRVPDIKDQGLHGVVRCFPHLLRLLQVDNIAVHCVAEAAELFANRQADS